MLETSVRFHRNSRLLPPPLLQINTTAQNPNMRKLRRLTRFRPLSPYTQSRRRRLNLRSRCLQCVQRYVRDGWRMLHGCFSRVLRGEFGFEFGDYTVEKGFVGGEADAEDAHAHFDCGPGLGGDVFPLMVLGGGKGGGRGRDAQLESIRLRCWIIVAR